MWAVWQLDPHKRPVEPHRFEQDQPEEQPNDLPRGPMVTIGTGQDAERLPVRPQPLGNQVASLRDRRTGVRTDVKDRLLGLNPEDVVLCRPTAVSAWR